MRVVPGARRRGGPSGVGCCPDRIKTAHRAVFDYDPKPGFLYVRSRAISSRCNDNWDEFPAAEIAQGYRTFIGKPVFVNHHNDNHRRARGVVVDAVLHEDFNPDGSPDTWAEVLMEVDAVRFPKLAEAILADPPQIDRTSMGCDVEYSLCSFCGNRAATPLEYCAHIPKLKGQRIRRTTASGTKEDVLVREICYGLSFFENSLLVEEPADPTAFFLGVDTRGLEKAASKQGKADRPARIDVHADALRELREVQHAYGKLAAVDDTRNGVLELDAMIGMTGDPEVVHFYIQTMTVEEAQELAARFPASCRMRATTASTFAGEPGTPSYVPHIERGGVTGYAMLQSNQANKGIYEAGVKRYRAVVRVAQSPGLPVQWKSFYGSSYKTQDEFERARRARQQAGQARLQRDPRRRRSHVGSANCPVCGETGAYNGQECMVCRFIKPPDDCSWTPMSTRRRHRISARRTRTQAATSLRPATPRPLASLHLRAGCRAVRAAVRRRRGRRGRRQAAVEEEVLPSSGRRVTQVQMQVRPTKGVSK